jgi:hypothetical protein
MSIGCIVSGLRQVLNISALNRKTRSWIDRV